MQSSHRCPEYVGTDATTLRSVIYDVEVVLALEKTAAMHQ
jgi:hypothetical protein